ncbi:MAG: hypothetical protein PHQ86_02505 [Dehalococcoidales bacterium]|nr:hypothetical protein [Dehalococcoidales bacterium]
MSLLTTPEIVPPASSEKLIPVIFIWPGESIISSASSGVATLPAAA